ncbi:hypothetical protein MRX96_025055 [Rhipicephalus microplus]
MSHVDLKVVLLGKEYGGKTSLVERYLYDRFDASTPYQNTIGAAYGAKQIAVRNRKITLGIWDTAGSERYEAMSRIYYRGAGAAIVCFDLTDRESYQKAKFWVEELRKHEEDYADDIGAKMFETSSKTGEGIAELFCQIAKDHIEAMSPSRNKPGTNFRLEEPASQGGGCC